MANLFERLGERQPRQGEKATNPNNRLAPEGTEPMEDDQNRQARLEARLDTLAADLRRFFR
jgi:hypothetical protein